MDKSYECVKWEDKKERERERENKSWEIRWNRTKNKKREREEEEEGGEKKENKKSSKRCKRWAQRGWDYHDFHWARIKRRRGQHSSSSENRKQLSEQHDYNFYYL